jgi:hypothetical protein
MKDTASNIYVPSNASDESPIIPYVDNGGWFTNTKPVMLKDGDVLPANGSKTAAIYKLYSAGILQGIDAAHNASPASNIKRSEVAVILTRMMDSAARIEFDME